MIRISLLIASSLFLVSCTAQPNENASERAKEVVEYWTPERMRRAQPRDFRIDLSGDGAANPSARNFQLASRGNGGGNPNVRRSLQRCNDNEAPVVADLSPGEGSTNTESSLTIEAKVTDDCGIREVSALLDGQNWPMTLSPGSDNLYYVVLTYSGTTTQEFCYTVTAKDTFRGGGKSTTSIGVCFTQQGSGGGGDPSSGCPTPPDGTGDTCALDEFDGDVNVAKLVGRIYFEMPANAGRRRWNGYICSGTIVTDDTDGRSIILTAAHCVYDDRNKAFARNVLFIPTVDGRTDLNCANDFYGCWVPSFGVVDLPWSQATWPDNIPYDYAYYVVSDNNAHVGNEANLEGDKALESLGSLPINFSTKCIDNYMANYIHALGYPASQDPLLMYSAEVADVVDVVGTTTQSQWLPSSGLTGGSSGGSWIMNLGGIQQICSVNSWGYTNGSPGMAGPYLTTNDSNAQCVFQGATDPDQDLSSFDTANDGDAGLIVTCPA